jgi:A/G-specific adenine glycosylase
MKGQIDLVKNILVWYGEYHRDLPWRKTYDPYHILVSEVMLQQTQVDRVVTKYTQFLDEFPTVTALAKASTADVIRAWAGLGYNRRALFLQRTAVVILEKHNNIFPKNIHALLELPGIGEYTARAILSFAFDVPVAVMDTNHRKFYSRVFGHKKMLTDKELLVFAQEFVNTIVQLQMLFSKKDATCSVVYYWNQALMDFMSAVAKKNTHPLVQDFILNYPEIPKKKQKKKTVKFRDTDRYYRGRIIALLREKESVRLATVQKQFDDISPERFQKIIAGLEKDGLIKQANHSIVLP